MLNKFNNYCETFLGIIWRTNRDEDENDYPEGRDDREVLPSQWWGFWLLPDGKLRPVGMMQHQEAGRDIYKKINPEGLHKDALNEKAEKLTIVDFLKMGWALLRIVIDGSNNYKTIFCDYDSSKGLDSLQNKALTGLRKEYKISKIIEKGIVPENVYGIK
jgi:hypothetical protein